MTKKPTYEELKQRVGELEKEYLERKQIEEALQESEEKFRDLFNNAGDAIFIRTREGRFLEVNQVACDRYGYSRKEFLQMGPKDLDTPDHSERIPERTQSILQKGRHIFETVHVTKDEKIIPVEISSRTIDYKRQLNIISIVRDITERKQTEEMLKKAHDELESRVQQRTAELLKANDQLKIEIEERKRAEKQINESLSEKEVLLSEIHHRVKNNFEIISSFLDMSSMQTENKEIQNLWGDTRARIHSMALIHDQLYQNDRFDQIDMERHVRNMLDHLSHIYAGNEKGITSVIEPSEVYLSVNQAIPCSLVLNELIANAFKYAFKKRRKGAVRVSINNSTDDTVLMRVKDDGDGIPEGIDFNNAKGLGLKLVRYLVDGQLNGEMRVNNYGGTEICIEFKRSM